MRSALQLITLVFIVFALSAVAHAQAKTPPTFAKYHVAKTFKGKPAPARIIGKQARLFRTAIRNNAKSGPNFAGHYTLIRIGCGSSCGRFVIIDAQNGSVFFPKEIAVVSTSPWVVDDPLAEEETMQFRKDSRLLIVVGSGHMDKAGHKGKYYYEWRNNNLKLIYALKRNY